MTKIYNGDGTKWEPEEIEALPATDTVFEAPKMKFSDHTWVQEGYQIIDTCPACPRYGVPIPYGQMLIKDEKGYRLVDEITRQ